MATAPYTVQEAEVIRKHVVPWEQARIAEMSGNSIEDSDQVVLFWPWNDDKLMVKARRLLDQETSAKNAADCGQGKHKHYVTDAVGDGMPLAGDWRGVQTRLVKPQGEEQPGIYQTLRRGWATALSDSETRLAGCEGSPADAGFAVTIMWPNIANTAIDDLTAARLTTLTVPDPIIEGEKYTGTFACGPLQGQKVEGDGAGVITQTLTKLNTIAATTGANIGTALAAMKYTVQHDASVLNLFGFQTGAGEDMAVVIPNLDPADANWTKCMVTATNADILAAFVNVPNTSHGWTYHGRQWRKQTNNTAALAITFKIRTWNALAFDGNARDMEHNNPQGYKRAKVLRLTGLTKAKAETEYDLMVPPAAVAWDAIAYHYLDYVTSGGTNYICIIPHTGGVFADDLTAGKWVAATYVLDSKRINEAGEGQYVLTAVAVPAYDGTGDADATVLKIRTSNDGGAPAIVRVWPLRSATAKGTLTEAAGKARTAYTFETVAYTHIECEITDHGNGTFTVEQLLVNSSDANLYWEKLGLTYDYRHRILSDGTVQTLTVPIAYFYASRLTEKSAMDYINGRDGKSVTVPGNAGVEEDNANAHITNYNVSKRGRWNYLAFCTTEDPADVTVSP
jgi:hypothetical protein